MSVDDQLKAKDDAHKLVLDNVEKGHVEAMKTKDDAHKVTLEEMKTKDEAHKVVLEEMKTKDDAHKVVLEEMKTKDEDLQRMKVGGDLSECGCALTLLFPGGRGGDACIKGRVAIPA